MSFTFMFRKWIGNLLIVFPLVGLLVMFEPILKVYFSPPTIQPIHTLHTFSITIPKIHAQAKIIEQIDPWNQVVYDAALEKGVAQAKGSAYPGQKGTLYLFAHSSQAPWEITQNNIPFLRLGEMKNKDKIYISNNNKIYYYSITDKKEVWPNQTEYLTNLQPTRLILQTCTPIGTSFMRLLIFATLTKTEKMFNKM